MSYGRIELQYAEPFARALVESLDFKKWVLEQTQFSAHADTARLMHEEAKARRTPSAGSWWLSVYTKSCKCPWCSEQETYLLAVFSTGAFRFALHCEFKRPGDGFSRNSRQAENYGLRAKCWSQSPPSTVLPHDAADTVLIFAEEQRAAFSSQIQEFGSALTFETITMVLPRRIDIPSI